MVETFFNENDRRNLKTLAEEVPRLRSLIEELLETLEVLGDEELMKSIKKSGKDIQEGRLLGFKGLLKELGLNEQKI